MKIVEVVNLYGAETEACTYRRRTAGMEFVCPIMTYRSLGTGMYS